ncbi:hypothetical protein E2I00_016197, partial [Balaenoptera physalus]
FWDKIAKHTKIQDDNLFYQKRYYLLDYICLYRWGYDTLHSLCLPNDEFTVELYCKHIMGQNMADECFTSVKKMNIFTRMNSPYNKEQKTHAAIHRPMFHFMRRNQRKKFKRRGRIIPNYLTQNKVQVAQQ